MIDGTHKVLIQCYKMVYNPKHYDKKKKKKYYKANREYILEMRKLYREEVKSGKRKVKTRLHSKKK